MIVVICAKYKRNPSRTVDATERTRFSKSRPNDLEDICQGQGSSHATHPLMLLIICTKYGNNPSRTVDATEWTRDAGQTDGRTDRRTDGQTDGVKPIYPPTTSLCVGYNDQNMLFRNGHYINQQFSSTFTEQCFCICLYSQNTPYIISYMIFAFYCKCLISYKCTHCVRYQICVLHDVSMVDVK